MRITICAQGLHFALETSVATLESIGHDRELDSEEKEALEASRKILDYIESNEGEEILLTVE